DSIDPQSDHSVQVKVRVTDSDSGHPAASVISDAFEIKYYAITWVVQDANGSAVTGLDTAEQATSKPVKAAWIVTVANGDTGLDGTGIVRYYPYNGNSSTDPVDSAYTTVFRRAEADVWYSQTVTDWRCTGSETKTVTMDTAATINIVYSVEAQTIYDNEDDAISIVAWLNRKGQLVSDMGTDSSDSISVNVYDTAGTLLNQADLGDGITVDATGVFDEIVYDPTGGLTAGQSYKIKSVITYNATEYIGITVFTVPVSYTYIVKIGAIYSSTNDSLITTAWLDRSGVVVTDPGDITIMVMDMSGTTMDTQSFDGYDSILDSVCASNLANGIYSGVEWDPAAGITAQVPYAVKATISYRGKDYSAVETFSKTDISEVQEGITDVQTEIESVTTSMGGVTTSMAGVATQMTTVGTKMDTVNTAISTTIPTQITGVKTETARILLATGEDGYLSEQIGGVSATVTAEVKPHLRAGILSRQTMAKSGDTTTVAYRTTTGLSPDITVYSPANAILVSSVVMTEVGVTGVYEYALTFAESWGTGEFTIICSESTLGTADSMTITVLTTDLTEISSSLDTVSATTAGLGDLGDDLNKIAAIPEQLGVQVNMIEASLSKISGDLTEKVQEAASAVGDLEVVYEQLSGLSEQIKELGATDGIDLEKVYEVSKERMADIDYLKNKTEELKALIELSQKMIDNVANQPVTQTWFEFR
ncbi:MAG: hypothetical protein KAJ18_04510, partial [Candidatus Omnitrophica bacterium]|nr:hypothetical protein [Candidatus Omnitrophota bacterium]